MDWNNDGKKDLIMGQSYDDGRVMIYTNAGTHAAPLFNGYSFLQVGGMDWLPGNRSMPDVYDWNNDGLDDILCGEEALGRVYLLTNSGAAGSPLFAASSFIQNSGTTLWLGVDTRSAPVVVDWDLDGNKDLLIGNYWGRIFFYRNTGSDASPTFNGYTQLQAGGTTLNVGNFSRPEVFDWNGDGMTDLIVGSSAGEVWVFLAINPSLPHLALQARQMNDDDADDYLERGEGADLVCTLRNDSAAASNVVLTLSTESPWCTITDNNTTFPGIGAGSTTSNAGDPFRLRVDSNAPPGQAISFRLDVSSDAGLYEARYHFIYNVALPNLILTHLFVNDSRGDTNCALSGGEDAYIVTRILNADYPADNVNCRLSTDSAHIALQRSEVNLGTVGKDQSVHNGATPFSLSVGASAPQAAVYEFFLEIWYDTCTTTTTYAFLVGDYAVDDTASYSWVDTTGGTSLALSWCDYAAAPLPFPFTLYGKPYATAYITSNGQIMFENPDGWYYNARPIPEAALPNALIAPYWNLLNPTLGGTIRHKTFGSEPNRYWVAEWNSVPYYFDSLNTCTFEAILHEDGRIIFQYGDMGSGTYSNGSRATVGIEGATGLFGEEYSCWTANNVMPGDAIEISVPGSVVDTDEDGLPDDYEQIFTGGLGATPGGDTDGDGRTDGQELRCLTDPNDSNSVLRIEQVDCPANDHVIRWQCIAGVPYNVRHRSELAGGSWSNLNPVPIVGPDSCTAAYTSAVPAARSFYRISVP